METEYLGNKEKSNHYNFYTRQKYSGFSRCDNQFG